MHLLKFFARKKRFPFCTVATGTSKDVKLSAWVHVSEAPLAGIFGHNAMERLNCKLPERSRFAPSSTPRPQKQQLLSWLIDEAEHRAFLKAFPESDERTVLTEMLPGASSWLGAVPSHDQGLAFDPAEFIAEVRSRLLVPV